MDDNVLVEDLDASVDENESDAEKYINDEISDDKSTDGDESTLPADIEVLKTDHKKVKLDDGVVVPAHMSYTLTPTIDKADIKWLDSKTVLSFTTPYKLKSDIIKSAVHKEIRRCRYNTAAMFLVDGIMAGHMTGSVENTMWNILMLIADSDIGPADPSMSIKLFELYKRRLAASVMESKNGISFTTQAQLYISTAGKLLGYSSKSRVSDWFKSIHDNIGDSDRKSYQDIIAGLRSSLRDENLEDIWYYVNYAFRIKVMFGNKSLRTEVLEIIKNYFSTNDYVKIQLEMLELPAWRNTAVTQKTETIFTPIKGPKIIVPGTHKKLPDEYGKKKIGKIQVFKRKSDMYMDTKPLVKLATIFLSWKYCQLPTNKQTSTWIREAADIDIASSLDIVNFYQSGYWVPEIADYMLCMNTKAGKKLKRGMRHHVEYGCSLAKESIVWKQCSMEYQKLVLQSYSEFDGIFGNPCDDESKLTFDEDSPDEPASSHGTSKPSRKFIKGF